MYIMVDLMHSLICMRIELRIRSGCFAQTRIVTVLEASVLYGVVFACGLFMQPDLDVTSVQGCNVTDNILPIIAFG